MTSLQLQCKRADALWIMITVFHSCHFFVVVVVVVGSGVCDAVVVSFQTTLL